MWNLPGYLPPLPCFPPTHPHNGLAWWNPKRSETAYLCHFHTFGEGRTMLTVLGLYSSRWSQGNRTIDFVTISAVCTVHIKLTFQHRLSLKQLTLAAVWGRTDSNYAPNDRSSFPACVWRGNLEEVATGGIGATVVDDRLVRVQRVFT